MVGPWLGEQAQKHDTTQRRLLLFAKKKCVRQDGRLSLLLDFVWAQSVRMAGSNYYEILYGRSHRAGTQLLSNKIKRVS